MKLATAMYMAALLLAPGVGLASQGEIELPANQPGSKTFTFPMVLSPAARNCLDPDAEGVVIAHTFGNVENLQVIIHNMPPNTDFVLFIIQVPNAPFGLAWYNGDILTDDMAPASLTLSGGSMLGHSSFPLALCPRLMFSQHRPRSPVQRRAR